MADVMKWIKAHKIISVIIVFVFLALLGALFGEDPGTEDTVVADTSSRISLASERHLLMVTEGLEDGFSITEVHSIKSRDFNNVYFVGGLLQGPGVEDGIAIWAIAGEGNMIMSANQIANEFSPYPLGSTTDAQISMSDDGAGILRDYLSNMQ